MASTLRSRVSSLQTPDPISDVVFESGNAARSVLFSYDQMPKWFRHESNKYILSGYRDISGSFHTSLCSLSYLHNESINIYSHLIPAIFFLLGEWYIQHYWGFTGADSIALSIFMLAAVTCLSLSVAYHTFMNHSRSVGHFCLRLDMLGVVLFLLGDLVLGTYLIFWCECVLRNIYWSLSGLIGMLTIFVTMHPKFQGTKHRLLRTLMFVATGLSGVSPLVHGISMFGLSRMLRKAFLYTLAKAGCLLLGALIYVTRFPESRYPGKFDLCSSHSIFHILVVGAAIVQLAGYRDAFSYAHANPTCLSL